jgi:drug/metabolite transporter (DMT)-like permease
MTWVWFLCAILPPAFWAISNIFDQYVTRHYCPDNPLVFLSIAGWASVPVAVCLVPFALADPLMLEPMTIVWSVLAALAFSLALIPYFYALSIEDAHTISPLIQSNIFLVALLAWVILGESLSVTQMVGGLVMIAAAILSTRPSGLGAWPWRAIVMILTAAVLWALFNLFLRLLDPRVETVTVAFWVCVAWGCLSAVLSLSPAVARGTWAVLRRDRGLAFGLNLTQQLGDIGASAARAAALAIPVVPAAVTVVVGGALHPFYALIFGAVAAQIFPRLYTFNHNRADILFRVSCFIALALGLWLVVTP